MTIAAIYQGLVICQTVDIVNPHKNPCKTNMIPFYGWGNQRSGKQSLTCLNSNLLKVQEKKG